MKGYGMGPRKLRLLQINMVSKAGGYFCPPFKGYHGVTKGDHVSPTIFNVVVDNVTRHWVMVEELTKLGEEGLG